MKILQKTDAQKAPENLYADPCGWGKIALPFSIINDIKDTLAWRKSRVSFYAQTRAEEICRQCGARVARE